MRSVFLISLIILHFKILGSTGPDVTCLENRAGLDIGSGSTKYRVFQVDFCKNNIHSLLFEKNFPIFFKEDLKKSIEEKFSKDVQESLILALNEIISKNQELKVVKMNAIATEAFRVSKNGQETLDKIKKDLKLDIKIIEQETESLLGLKSAFMNLDEREPKLMWDIGGGSMQMVLLDGNKKFHYFGKLASISFKDLIIKEVKKAKENLLTPNPMSKKEIQMARRLVLEEIKNIPADLKAHLSKVKHIIGIGGVFQYSLLGQLKSQGPINYSQLINLLNERRKLSDAELKSEYASTEVTNIILVATFMEALKIKQVEVRKVNLAESLVLD